MKHNGSCYFQVTTTDEPGYPSRFLCEKCFDFAHEYDRAKGVDRCNADNATGGEEVAVFCSICNAPLANVDADITVTALDIDALAVEHQ
jgi:hypothetical protein